MKVKSASRPRPDRGLSPWELGKLPWILVGLAALLSLVALWNLRRLNWPSTPPVSFTSEDRGTSSQVIHGKRGGTVGPEVATCATSYQFRYDGRLYSGSSSECRSRLIYFDPVMPWFSTVGRPNVGNWRGPLSLAVVLGVLGLSLATVGRWRKWRGAAGHTDPR
jgi:hypothetical protein